MGSAAASGSLGQLIFVPLGFAFLTAYGWQMALVILAGFVMIVPFLATALRGKSESGAAPAPGDDLSFGETMRAAFGHTSYLLLIAGFFVCGFHIAFITTFLPDHLTDIGIEAEVASWTIGVIGLFNIIGAYTAGVLGGKHSKRWLLSFIYFTRSIAIVAFLLAPPSNAVALTFAAVIGLLWLSTVPLTSGLVGVMFGTKYMATLFGIVFLSHQVGAYIGVRLAGIYYDAYGNYDLVWWGGVGLGLLAALVHLPIRETLAPRFAATAAR